MDLLIKTLRVLADDRLRESGNITSQVKSKDIEAVKLIADKFYELPISTGDHLDIFELGLEMGRDVKQKMVTRVKLPNLMLYFVGTEADVLRKLAEVPDKEDLKV